MSTAPSRATPGAAKRTAAKIGVARASAVRFTGAATPRSKGQEGRNAWARCFAALWVSKPVLIKTRFDNGVFTVSHIPLEGRAGAGPKLALN